MDSMDPCSIGPLTCGVVDPKDMDYDHSDYDNENETEKEGSLQHLFAFAAKKGRASLQHAFRSKQQPRPPPHQQEQQKQWQQPQQEEQQSYEDENLVELTKARVMDFQNRGWLSQQETRKYMTILDAAPIQRGNLQHFEEYICSEIQKELDSMEDRMTGGMTPPPVSSSSSSSSRTPPPTTFKTPYSTTSSASSSRHVVTKTHSPYAVSRPLGDATSKLNSRRKIRINTNNNNHNSGVILSNEELSKQISDDEIDQLFVETCFFARLGFVQPPSCLKCAYRESIKGGEAMPAKCNRWVAWRRDANYIIHPSYLKENTVFIQCHAVQQLLEEESVDSYKWDVNTKTVLFPSSHSP